jgi:hypothetical protein
MATVLHLVKGESNALIEPTIEQQLAAGDHVVVILLEGAARPASRDGVTLHRVPEELDYGHLIDLVFQADRVIAW